MKAQINHEKFLALVARLEETGQEIPGMDSLARIFRTLAEHVNAYQKAQGTEDEQLAWNKLQESQKELEVAFEEVCRGWGTSFEEIKEHVTNPMNFSPKEWQDIQEANQEAHKAIEIEKKESRPANAKCKQRKWA